MAGILKFSARRWAWASFREMQLKMNYGGLLIHNQDGLSIAAPTHQKVGVV